MAREEPSYLPTVIPSPRQLEFQDWEFGVFLHFGIRTFYEGHRDWDGQAMSPAQFNPSALDCDQWVRTAKDAGVRYMVLTAKHHDGFANWPSAYTDFSVASSPWEDGKGDVVREFTDACRRHDMAVGLYYSPADASSPSYTDSSAYDDYFINQISEILTGYGKVDILWFDGCGSEGHTYDWPRIMSEIRRMQPEILIFNMGDPDYRWVGNESGIAPSPCWNTVNAVPFSVNDSKPVASPDARPTWLPAECDCMMRYSNWFYSDQDEHTVKSLDELLGIYYLSIGRGCNLLLNIGPDRRGLLPDTDAKRLMELGTEVKCRFSKPLATLADFTELENVWEYRTEQPFLLDHVVIQENIENGEHVRRYRVQIYPTHGQNPITVFDGYNIGHKTICNFPLVKTTGVRVDVCEADAPMGIRSIEIFCLPGQNAKLTQPRSPTE